MALLTFGNETNFEQVDAGSTTVIDGVLVSNTCLARSIVYAISAAFGRDLDEAACERWARALGCTGDQIDVVEKADVVARHLPIGAMLRVFWYAEGETVTRGHAVDIARSDGSASDASARIEAHIMHKRIGRDSGHYVALVPVDQADDPEDPDMALIPSQAGDMSLIPSQATDRALIPSQVASKTVVFIKTDDSNKPRQYTVNGPEYRYADVLVASDTVGPYTVVYLPNERKDIDRIVEYRAVRTGALFLRGNGRKLQRHPYHTIVGVVVAVRRRQGASLLLLVPLLGEMVAIAPPDAPPCKRGMPMMMRDMFDAAPKNSQRSHTMFSVSSTAEHVVHNMQVIDDTLKEHSDAETQMANVEAAFDGIGNVHELERAALHDPAQAAAIMHHEMNTAIAAMHLLEA